MWLVAELGFGALLVDVTAPGEVPDVAGDRLFDGRWLRVLALDDAQPRSVPASWVVAMSLAWTAFGGLVLLSAGLIVRQLLRRRRAG